MAHSNQTTMRGIRTLLGHCDRLESLGDLDCFPSVSGAEIVALREWAKKNNFKLNIDQEKTSEYGVYFESAIM